VNLYPFATRTLELVIRPGHHVMVVKAGAQNSDAWEFNAAPGNRLSHVFAAQPAPNALKPEAPTPPTRRSHTAPLFVTAIGASALVTRAVLGVVTLNKVHALEQKCPHETDCPPGTQQDIDAAREYVRATDILLIGGGIVTAAGVGWLLWSFAAGPPSHRAARA